MLNNRFTRSAAIAAIASASIAVVTVAEAQDLRPPESSRIVEIYDTAADQATRGAGSAQRAIDTTGYVRPDMIGFIYSGEFPLVPATGLDNLRYFAQTVAELSAQCPALSIDSAKFEIMPYLFANVADLVERFQSGRLTTSEILQAAWMGMQGLSEHWSCRWDPSGPLSRDQAQAECDSAAATRAKAGVLPSDDAMHDVALFLSRHGCRGGEAQRLARQLIAFGREAQARAHLTERMPSPASRKGRAYSAILQNCLRPAFGNAEYAWCGCYVQTLHTIGTPSPVLDALAENPFLDGATYMTWLVRNVAGGAALYDCSKVFVGNLDWREGHAPRPTACLVNQAPADRGGMVCRYRAAWGEFTMGSSACEPEVSSRRWGFRELDCAAGGVIAQPSLAPRRWSDGAFTMIDYEHSVAEDFVPPLPPDARHSWPLQVRFFARDKPGLLKSMSLGPLTAAEFMTMRMPFNLLNASGPEIAAIDREYQLILTCTYKATGGASSHIYWYETKPRHVGEGRVRPEFAPYFAAIGGPVTVCPAYESGR